MITQIQNNTLSRGFGSPKLLKNKYIVSIMHSKGVKIIIWIKIDATVNTCLLIYDCMTLIMATKEIRRVAMLAIRSPNPPWVESW